MRMCSLLLCLSLMLGVAPAIGQQHRARQPYDLETFGMFRSLVLSGDFSSKISLRDVMANRPTTGVGAVADARGEITIFGGKLIVSHGKEGSYPVGEHETAALLAVGTVTGWRSIMVDRDVPPNEIEGFIAQAAVAHGIQPHVSFAFQVQGT